MNTTDLKRDIDLLTNEPVQKRNSPVNPLYNVWAEIDLRVIRQNLSIIRGKVGDKTQILVVVKSDAYGHGLKEISRTVLQNGADLLGVTSITEALELRKLHPEARIIILSAGMYSHSKIIVQHDLIPIVCSRQMGELLNEAAREMNKRVKVHIKIDTGMGRLGAWHENAVSFIEYVHELPYVELEGICTHFSSSSSSKMDLEYSRYQLSLFHDVITDAEKKGINIPLKHVANSGAVLKLSEAYMDIVRTGISVYGLFPSSEFECDLKIKSALSLKSRIAFIKEVLPGRTISYGRTFTVMEKTKIATVPVGYSNGYCRSLSNIGKVLVNGRYAPVAGIVTMDQIMIDIGDVNDVSVGDEVVLIGKQKGKSITASQMAQWAGTICYEVLCKLSVPRVYFE